MKIVRKIGVYQENNVGHFYPNQNMGYNGKKFVYILDLGYYYLSLSVRTGLIVYCIEVNEHT